MSCVSAAVVVITSSARTVTATSSDSVSPHISSWAVVVIVDLVQRNQRLKTERLTGTTLPRSVKQSTERQVSLKGPESTHQPSDMTEHRLRTFDGVIHDWR